jgi:pullulanase-like protein
MKSHATSSRSRALRAGAMLVVMLAILVATVRAQASPSSVTVVADLQSEAGCPGDFDAACPQTTMTQGPDGIWRLNVVLPADTYHYFAVIDHSFAEVYGAHATLNGPLIELPLATPSLVKFYYDDVSHWITDNQTSIIASVVGDFQSELGCSGDFVPGCLRSWLEDPDGDGVYRFVTSLIPQGTYSALVVRDESFPGLTSQVSFTVPANATTCFTFFSTSNTLDISTDGCTSVAGVPEPRTLEVGAAAVLILAFTAGCRRRRSAALNRANLDRGPGPAVACSSAAR